MRRRIKALLGRKKMDEAEIIHQTIKGSAKLKTMIDVGAHNGASLEEFARDGWRVYAFEPDSKNRAHLIQLCRRFPTVIIDSRAVSNRDEEQHPFYTSKVSTGISGLSSFHPSHKESEKVDTVTLETFCKNKGIKAVDFLKVDAEGFDLFVLQGVPWESIKPKVILCEFEDRKTIPLGYTFQDMADFLLDRCYHMLISEWYPVVEYGTTHRWRRFMPYPCKLLDNNAFGNIIAVDDEKIYVDLCSMAETYGKRFL
jgi:FkbM family methyltransferase